MLPCDSRYMLFFMQSYFCILKVHVHMYYWPFACASYFLQSCLTSPTNPSSWFWRYNAPMTLCVIYEIVYASIMQSFTSYLGCCTIWWNRPHSQLFYYVTSKDSAAKILCFFGMLIFRQQVKLLYLLCSIFIYDLWINFAIRQRNCLL